MNTDANNANPNDSNADDAKATDANGATAYRSYHPSPQDRHEVLETVAEMLDAILGSDVPDGTGIGMETRFADDLELESVDFVALTGRLTERWGDRVNFVVFLSGLELDEIIQLTVGQLVDYIATCLHAPHSAVRS